MYFVHIFSSLQDFKSYISILLDNLYNDKLVIAQKLLFIEMCTFHTKSDHDKMFIYDSIKMNLSSFKNDII